MKLYNKRTWLNNDDSPSTGSVVAFDGYCVWKKKKIRETFLSVGDCFVRAKLVKTDDDTMNDFVNKMEILKHDIELFITHLEKTE